MSWGREGEERGEGREGDGEGFAGPMSNYFLRACERLHGKTITYSYAYVPVGTVIFDTNNHEAN